MKSHPSIWRLSPRDPFQVMTKIRNAGAIFIGEYSSEPLGDYFAGPNHILPTNGTAKFFSPLSVDDFVKKSSIVYYSREALEEVHEDIDPVCKGRAADCPRKFHCRYVLKKTDDTGGSRMERTASITRNTKETQIALSLNLDGKGSYQVLIPALAFLITCWKVFPDMAFLT